MNEQEKSLKLAELMGWRIVYHEECYANVQKDSGNPLKTESLEPYCEDSNLGLAQFAAILLKNMEVLAHFCRADIRSEQDNEFSVELVGEPTQANILDEILRMNGVAIDNGKEKSVSREEMIEAIAEDALTDLAVAKDIIIRFYSESSDKEVEDDFNNI